VWDTTTGSFMPGFPAQMNDLMFFNTPAVADVNGSGQASVIQGSAVYDLRAKPVKPVRSAADEVAS